MTGALGENANAMRTTLHEIIEEEEEVFGSKNSEVGEIGLEPESFTSAYPGVSCVTPGDPYVLHCFPPFATDLTQEHHRHLDIIAQTIRRSLSTSRPISRVAIVGHSSTWHQTEEDELEQRALERAENARGQLILRLQGMGVANQVDVLPALGRSDTEKWLGKLYSSTSESEKARIDRALNRRVEIFLRTLLEPITEKSSVMIDRCAEPYRSCLRPFEKSDVDWKSVRQQGLANCPLHPILAALGRQCPEKVRQMISLKQDEPYKSTMRGRPGKGPSVFHVGFPGAHKTIIISPRLHFPRPKDAHHLVVPEPENLMFARAADGGWVSYIEKAYVVLRGGFKYESLDFRSDAPPSVQQVFLDIVGSFDQIESEFDLAEEKLRQFVTLNIRKSDLFGEEATYSMNVLIRFLKDARRKPTVAGTRSDPDSLIGEHTYLVLGKQKDEPFVFVREFMRGDCRRVLIRNFWREFDVLLQSSRSPCDAQAGRPACP